MSCLDEVARRISACRRCSLAEGRRNPVPGEGSGGARLMLIGEAPGGEEDITGRPFVGRAGRLLTEVLEEAGLSRREVFITSVIKCRPPNNRRPRKGEIRSCLGHLKAQMNCINPRAVLLMGGVAAEAVLGIKRVGGARGRPVRTGEGRTYLVTYHPAAVLRNINLLPLLREDLLLARDLAYRET